MYSDEVISQDGARMVLSGAMNNTGPPRNLVELLLGPACILPIGHVLTLKQQGLLFNKLSMPSLARFQPPTLI